MATYAVNGWTALIIAEVKAQFIKYRISSELNVGDARMKMMLNVGRGLTLNISLRGKDRTFTGRFSAGIGYW
jgi:hypothetical protein